MKFDTLISTSALAENINNPDFLIIDCRFVLSNPTAGYEFYNEAHIPGAYYADLNQDLSGIPHPYSGRHPLPDENVFIKKLQAWSIHPTTQVVAYDADGGAMAAGRLWWLLRAYGHEKSAVLDGGIGAWINEGYEINNRTPPPRSSSYAKFKFNSSWMLDLPEMEHIIKADDWLVIDARTENRFHGFDEIIDVTGGHIPGAANLPYTKCYTPDGHFLSKENLNNLYAIMMSDQQSSKKTVVYCGSGVTSVVHVLGMMYCGLERPFLYPGSWSEWIKDHQHEIAVK